MASEVAAVVNRCESGKESQSLDLSECGLMSVPDAIFHLMRETTILKCDLSRNQLKKLPAKVATKFKDIVEFNASNNQLSTLRDEFGQLKSLTHLNLSTNNIEMVPEAIYNMPSLIHLDLCNNNICEFITSKLLEMKSLKIVNLENNPLTSDCFYLLSNLNDVEVKLSAR
ncbi:leucine-rich repeat-containing protein 20-like [Antedon mediterranea]|uniref:leucine-rich repeat-containing protein 20-like n=1 Tax=Antedon mediterranea TaxID=105859 RepID=UPI003AF7BF15